MGEIKATQIKGSSGCRDTCTRRESEENNAVACLSPGDPMTHLIKHKTRNDLGVFALISQLAEITPRGSVYDTRHAVLITGRIR